ncbi:MAG TPA: glycoside hydrolase family 2 protein, partial [Acidobacteriota bacterium]|nr:glycoside hydrolase family 2 protein [Acidobacteriota bacterium]
GATEVDIAFTSPVFQHRVHLELADEVEMEADDNFFELFPGRVKRVRVRLARPKTLAVVRRALRVASVVDLAADD